MREQGDMAEVRTYQVLQCMLLYWRPFDLRFLLIARWCYITTVLIAPKAKPKRHAGLFSKGFLSTSIYGRSMTVHIFDMHHAGAARPRS